MPTIFTEVMDVFGYKDIDDGGDGLYIAQDLHDEYMEQTMVEMGALNGGL